MAEFNGTPHNTAKLGDFAKTVIMPGDPLRAKYIAEKFLDDVREVNHVRGMLAYTGTYKGVPVSVMGHGMGIPSIGIYSFELYKFYGVENIIRTGTAGGLKPDMKLFDVVLATQAYSASTYAREAFGYQEDLMDPDEGLVSAIADAATAAGKNIWKGIVGSSDNFYSDPEILAAKTPKYDMVAVEMESYGLFANAKYLDKKAACLLTISDIPGQETTPEERQSAFNDMIEIALETAIKL